MVTVELFHQILREEIATIRDTLGTQRFESGRFSEATDLFARISTAPTLTEFLTLSAYDELLTLEAHEED